MKNKQVMVIGGVLVVIGLILGYQFLSGRGGGAEISGGEKEMVGSEQSEGVVESGMQKLSDLLADGREIKCTFSHSDDDGNQTDGEIYVAGEKSRVNYASSISDNDEFDSLSGSVVMDGEYVYMWGSMMEEGLKMKLGEEMKEEDDSSFSGAEYMDLDQEVEYECDPWVSDQSVFVLPDDVEFRDLSVMMEDVLGQQCKVCESLEGEARTACEKQLDC